MNARYVQRGEAIDYVPAADGAAGDVVKVGGLVGVAKLDIRSGELGALALTGVYEIALKEGESVEAGDTVHFDPADGAATKTAGSGTVPFGRAVAAASGPGALVHVRLEQGL